MAEPVWDTIESTSALAVIRRGLRATPELTQGLGLTAMMGVAVAAGQVSVPIILQQAMERGGLTTGEVNIDAVWQMVVLGIAILVGTQVLAAITKRRMIRRSEAALKTLRVRVFNHVHSMSLAEHNQRTTGTLISRVTSDIDALSRFLDWGVFVWTVQPIVIVAIFVAMAFYSWVLALFSVVLFVPVYFIMRRMQDAMGRAHDRKRTAIGELLGAFSETLSGAEVIRAYAAAPRAEQRLSQASDRRYRAGLKANLFMSTVYVIGDLIGAVVLAGVVVIGVSQREALGLTASELIALVFLITMLNVPIAHMGETLNNAQEAISGWRKVLGLLDEPIGDLDPDDGETLPAGALSLAAVDVGFHYGDGVPALADVNIEIPAGVRVAIVGETGSGKSTFGRLLCRLADPTEGTIMIGGQRLDAISVDSRHAAVRMVPQDGFLFDMTIGENIATGRPGATAADAQAAVERLGLGPWLATMPSGLDTPVGERGRLLSVGERQLVSFARAAVADPGLLILDEATSSVDPQTDLMLTSAIDRLAVGRTVVSIAHRLSTAEAADLVLVFADGHLIEHGHHDDLVALNGNYARQYEAWTTTTSSSPSA